MKKKVIILILVGMFLSAIGGILIVSERISISDFTPDFLKGIVSAQSENPEDNRTISYELLNDGKVVHMWNTQDDYYFNKSSGIQFTNHYEDYWTRNIFCIGYYNNNEWNKIKCSDELSNFNRNIYTDDETYVNTTLWKDISYGNYNMRMGINYYLGLNDENLTITIYGKNIGIDLPFDLGFAWKITDVEIPLDTDQDSVLINRTSYNLDENIDLVFKNMTRIYTEYNYTYDEGHAIDIIPEENWTVIEPIPFFEFSSEYVRPKNITLTDKYISSNFLRVDWNKGLNYAVKMNGTTQEDFYIMLLINAGHFNAGQEKSTMLKWIDADLTSGLIHYYPLDETDGDALDSVGGIDGTITGATQGAGGKLGTSYSFDGSDNIDLGTSMVDLNEITISVWIYPDWDPVETYNIIIERSYDKSWSLMRWSNNDYLAWRIWADGGTERAYTGNLPDEQWTHIVATYDGTNMIIYVNGDEVDSTEVGGDIKSDTGNVHIGMDTTYNSAYWYGRLDEIGIWDRALDTDKISELWNSGSGLAYPFVAGDTCEPSSPLSENHVFTGSDNCTQSTNLDAGGYNITCSDDLGTLTLIANISNFDKVLIYDACQVNIFSGGFGG